MKINEMFANDRDPEIVPVEYWFERYRNWRAKELLTTDWTQLEDAPSDKVAFATYRQALRDLTKATDFANAEVPERP